MPVSYRHTVQIDSRDMDCFNRCRASALLGHLQEAAVQAAETGGFGRDVLMRQYNCFWMLTRIWFHLNRPLMWEEYLTIHTWHRGGKHALMYRDFDLYVGDEPIGESVSAWVLANADSRKLMKLGSIPALDETWGGDLCKTRLLTRLKMPKEMSELDRRVTHYSDTDINGHVNNTRYADFACDALRMDLLPDSCYLQEMQINYTAECRPGETLILENGRDGNTSFINGRDEDGKRRFEASLVFADC